MSIEDGFPSKHTPRVFPQNKLWDIANVFLFSLEKKIKYTGDYVKYIKIHRNIFVYERNMYIVHVWAGSLKHPCEKHGFVANESPRQQEMA